MTGASWRDHRDRGTQRQAPPALEDPPFYVPIGEFQADLYDRNAFTAGTAAEVDVLVDVLSLLRGSRVLDLGCGTGRHLRELATRGVSGHGLDASPALIAAANRLAAPTTTFSVADVREPVELGDHDAAMCLCHGGLGTGVPGDLPIVVNLARSVRVGGRVAFTVFHALFAARHLAPGDAFDTMSLTHHQRSEVHGPDGQRGGFDLWTSAYTVPGAVQLATSAGLEVVSVHGVEPGRYQPVDATSPVRLDDPELLVVAERTAEVFSS